MVRRTARHVICNAVEGGNQVLLFFFRHGTYFREAFGNELQVPHVVVHFGQQRVGGVVFFKDFHPGNERRNRSAQLVCGFFRQSYPHLVLFGSFWAEKGENGNHHEYKHYAELYEWVNGQAPEHERGIIANVEVVYVGFNRVGFGGCANAHIIARSLPSFSLLAHIGKRVGQCRAFAVVNVTVHLHLSGRVEHNNWYGVVAVYHFQHESEVCGLVGTVERTHCLGPYFHALVLFLLKVSYQEVRHNERAYGNQQRRYYQRNLEVLYPIKPLHDRYARYNWYINLKTRTIIFYCEINLLGK